MNCRPGCGACCIAPSIVSPLPGMPSGKPAGEPCAHLTREYACALFGRPERPGFCSGLQPSREICGTGRAQALALISAMEVATQPSR